MTNIDQMKILFAIKQVFEAYATDKSFREKVDSGNYSELNNEPSGQFFSKYQKTL